MSVRTNTRLTLGLGMLGVMVLAGCGGGTSGPNPPPPPPPPPPAPMVTTVEVTPASGPVFIGDTLPLTATVRDQHGTVMSGKTVTWASSSPTLATVSAAGKVVGVGAGNVTITAQVETKAGSAALSVVDPGPRVTLETVAAATGAIGSEGGTLTAISAAGVTYDFIVPANVLDATVNITMTPLAGFRKLPFSRGLIGGVEFQPSGLLLGPGARLVITPTVPIPALGPTELLIGFTYEGGGDSLRVQPAIPEAGGFTVIIEHFSGGGLAVGNVSDLTTLPVMPGGSIQQQWMAQLAPLHLPQDLNAAVAIFQGWRAQIEALIGQAESGVEAKIAVDLFYQWTLVLNRMGQLFPAASTSLNAALAGDQTALVSATQLAMKRGIAALNQQCVQARSLVDANNVLFLRFYAEALSPLLTDIGSGLTLTAQLATLCIQPVQSFSRFPNPFPPSSSAALDLTYGLKFGTDPALDGKFFNVTLTVSGSSSNGVNTLQTNAAGQLQPAAQIATGTTPISIQVQSCVAPTQLILTPLRFLGAVCHFSTINAGPEAPLTILTTALPDGTLGSSYSSTLEANGGVGNYQWSLSAGQLPPGLSLGPTGSITGTPTAAGTFTFTAKVVSGAQNTARELLITVGTPSGPLLWTFDTDLEGWTCSSTNACKWQLLSSNQFPQTSGWVALQDIGEAVSRTIALPSNARFLRFDASTHNVPGDISRVQVQVGGVTMLDQTFVNPGSNTAFNFVTMTIDISARAGQTVNIRFVQLDDGQGTSQTLKIDNISIGPN